MQFNFYFTNLCVDLNVKKGASRKEILTAYLNTIGGPNVLLDKFFNKCVIVPNEVKDIKLIEDDTR